MGFTMALMGFNGIYSGFNAILIPESVWAQGSSNSGGL